MTTYAIKDGILAYDSYETSENVVVDYDCNKRTIQEGVSFFIAGNSDEEQLLVDWYFDHNIRIPGSPDIEGFIIDGKEAFMAGLDKTGGWKVPLKPSKTYSIGTGSMAAFAAMDAGASAKRAVEIACNRDIYSGGRVRTLKL